MYGKKFGGVKKLGGAQPLMKPNHIYHQCTKRGRNGTHGVKRDNTRQPA
jgi:hypothetical protein